VEVGTLIAYGLIPMLVAGLLLLTVAFLAFLRKPRPEGIKFERWESGHISPGPARIKVGFQYFGFLIMFAALEPVVVTLLIISPSSRFAPENHVLVILAVLLIVAPILVFTLRQARETRYWAWR